MTKDEIKAAFLTLNALGDKAFPAFCIRGNDEYKEKLVRAERKLFRDVLACAPAVLEDTPEIKNMKRRKDRHNERGVFTALSPYHVAQQTRGNRRAPSYIAMRAIAKWAREQLGNTKAAQHLTARYFY